MRRWSALVLGVCTAAVTVTPAARQQSLTESTLSSTWRQIVTPDLIVMGNASSGHLKRTLSELGRFRDPLAMLFPDAAVTGAVPTWVVVLRDYQAFKRFQPRDGSGKPIGNVGAYFSRRPDANIIVLPASRGEDGLQT